MDGYLYIRMGPLILSPRVCRDGVYTWKRACVTTPPTPPKGCIEGTLACTPLHTPRERACVYTYDGVHYVQDGGRILYPYTNTNTNTVMYTFH